MILSILGRHHFGALLARSPFAVVAARSPYDFAQIHNRPYLNRSKSILKAWLLWDKLHSMIEVSRLKDLMPPSCSLVSA